MTMGRAVLFTPGDRSHRVERAVSGRAPAVVLDLEDGVAAGDRDGARAVVAGALPASRRPGLFVRVNPTGDPEQERDLAALAPVLAHLRGIVVPKVESADDVAGLADRLAALGHTAGPEIVPVVETCAGVLAVRSIAGAPRVATLMLGVLDLAGELGVDPVPGVGGLDQVRSWVVVAARAAGLPAPVDGPHPDLDDDEGLARSSRASRALGFGGRVVLHPRHLDLVDEGYAPTAAEVERARRILGAAESGAGSTRLPDGTFVDAPVIARARRVIDGTEGGRREHAPA